MQVSTLLETNCPHCGRRNECHGAASANAIVPISGAVAVCWGCRRMGIFTNGPLGLTVRAPDDTEAAELEADPRLQQLLMAMAAAETPADVPQLLDGQ